jgi:predicted anti-sigma-YlaC factor YlaD
MLSCNEVTRLLSDSQERTLRLHERMTMRMHLMMCSGCRNFGRQMAVIRSAMRTLVRQDRGPDPAEGDEAS